MIAGPADRRAVRAGLEHRQEAARAGRPSRSAGRIADIAWKRRGKGVLRLESNLARVVPDAGPERLAELSRAGMRSYMRYWMESFRLPAWSAERVSERLRRSRTCTT